MTYLFCASCLWVLLKDCRAVLLGLFVFTMCAIALGLFAIALGLFAFGLFALGAATTVFGFGCGCGCEPVNPSVSISHPICS